MSEVMWQEFLQELADWPGLVRVALRLTLACILGSIIGLNREHAGQAAGWRTHILVTLAAAVFVLAIREYGGSTADVSRIIQGVATGIGFVGAGAILRNSNESLVRGLSTAASVWLTAAVGVAIGVGKIWLPLVATLLGWFALAVLRRLERHMPTTNQNHDP